jgi:heme-degrading monooxygenase HmoA
MFARLLRIRTKIEQIDDVAKLFEESVIPLCRDQKGFQGAYFLADRHTGESIFITLWASEEDMLANEKSRFFQEQLVKFMDLFIEPPFRETYEVVVQE